MVVNGPESKTAAKVETHSARRSKALRRLVAQSFRSVGLGILRRLRRTVGRRAAEQSGV
jgi:hypothetical protein